MLFHEIELSREEILKAVADALEHPQSGIFVDTSVLLHCYEMRKGARQELLDAFAKLGNRLRIPLWAARETWDRTRGNNPFPQKPLQDPFARLDKALKQFVTEAKRYVDDETITQPESLTRNQYEDKLTTAQKGILDVANMARSYQRKADETSAVLIPFLNARLLPSDLIPILSRVRDEASLRHTHSVPPGFSDAGASDSSEGGPRGKPQNAHGDLIIWFEILDIVKKEEIKHLVLITRDVKKGDWAYKPNRLKDEQGRMRENLSVTLAHPLLVHEAKMQCPTLESVHVISLDEFAQIANSNLGFTLPELLAALQFEDMIQPTQNPPESAPAPVDQADEEEITFSPADLLYEFNEDNTVDKIIEDLRVSDFRLQRQAIERLGPQLPGATREQLIQIGRALATAASMRAVAPLEMLSELLTGQSTTSRVRSYLLVGALAAVYLTDSAELKKPTATPELAATLFSRENDDALKPAYNVVLQRLEPQRKQYLALPTEDPRPITLDFTTERAGAGLPILRGILAGDHELLGQGAAQSRRIVTSQGEEVDVEGLIYRLSQEFVVPVGRFHSEEAGTFRFTLSDTLGFVRWGPGSGVDLRQIEEQ